MPRQTARKIRDRARAMRKDMSGPEVLLWSQLKAKGLDGIKFRRQSPVGPFITDFLCDEHRLVIELDGESHDRTADYDARRTRFLKSKGYRVVRYNHDEVLKDLDSVLR